MSPKLAIADSAHRRELGIEIATSPQPRDFLDKPGLHHRVEAPLYAHGELRPAFGHERDGKNAGTAPIVVCALQLADRAARQSVYLERPLDPLPVTRCDPLRSSRVDAAQTIVQRLQAVLGGFAVELGAHSRIRARQHRETVTQGAQVKQRPADEQRQSAARANFVDKRAGLARKTSRRVRFRRIQDVDQMMRHDASNRRRRLGRAYVETAIDERRIHADDFERHSLGERKRKLRLTACRRPGEANVVDAARLPHELLPAQK